jgi:ABC-type transport system substrate-binding protein
MDGPVSPKVFGYMKMDKQYNYDPDKAKALLKEAKFDFSKTVNCGHPTGDTSLTNRFLKPYRPISRPSE